MDPEDAAAAIQHQIDAIWISNHGGRMVDNTISSIEALAQIAPLAQLSNTPLFVDGGFRSGTDILKALALGADFVFLGRPVLYGLAVGGSEGVRVLLERLETELEMAMKHCGVRRPSEARNKGILYTLRPKL